MHMLFVNLPVRDLPAATAFYTALGFSLHEQFSDERTASVVVDESIVVALATHEHFATLVTGEVADPRQGTSVVHSLTVQDPSDVDDLVGRALAAGGSEWLPAQEQDARYTGSFADLDGHPWQVVCLSPLHVIN